MASTTPFTDFNGRVYALTGVAGMGLSIAKLLIEYGASVSLADISQPALDDAFKVLGGDESRIMTARVDVGDWEQVEKWVADTVAKFGKLDGAANFAAAIGKNHGMKDMVDQDTSDWELIIRVNLTGLMHCVKAQVRAIKALKKKDANATGDMSWSIVNAASIQGVKGFAQHVAYSTSKHGAVGLTRSVAKEVGEDNIRVNCVAPGTIQTPLLDHSLDMMGSEVDKVDMPHAIKRVGTSEEVAQLTVFLLSDASKYITGSVYSVDGGWNS